MAAKYTAVVVTVFILCVYSGALPMDETPITPSPQHARYWSYGGETVLLLGGSDEDNLFNDPVLMSDNLDTLAACGGNYIRSTLSWRDENNVPPFEKIDGQYDLDRFNPEFFARLENCCRECQNRGIILQIEFWATFDYYRDNWTVSPWNPINNSTYTLQETLLKPDWPHHPSSKVQPFFKSVPAVNDDTALLHHQRRFVRKVLDVTVSYPNVLYCLDNETNAPPEWAVYWGNFIKAEQERRGASIHLTEMWDNWNITSPDHANTYEHPELFTYCDVSQNNWMSGQTHYDRLLAFRRHLEDVSGGPRPMNNVKIYGKRPAEGKTLPQENIERFWRNIFAGCASARFHRPDSGLGLNEMAQQNIRAARTFTDSFDIFNCAPRPDLLANYAANEAYLLANPPDTFALYFPAGGSVTMTAHKEQTDYRLRWFDPTEAEFGEEIRLKGPKMDLTTPDTAQSWMALVEAL